MRNALLASALAFGGCSDYNIFDKKPEPSETVKVDDFSETVPGDDGAVNCSNFGARLEQCLGALDEKHTNEEIQECASQILGGQVLDCCDELETCLDAADSKGIDLTCLRSYPTDPNGECCAVYDACVEQNIDPTSYSTYYPVVCNN